MVRELRIENEEITAKNKKQNQKNINREKHDRHEKGENTKKTKNASGYEKGILQIKTR